MIFIQGHYLIWRSTVLLIQTHRNLSALYAANYLEVKTICLTILRDFTFLKVLAITVHIAQLYLILGLVFANIKRDTIQMQEGSSISRRNLNVNLETLHLAHKLFYNIPCFYLTTGFLNPLSLMQMGLLINKQKDWLYIFCKCMQFMFNNTLTYSLFV